MSGWTKNEQIKSQLLIAQSHYRGPTGKSSMQLIVGFLALAILSFSIGYQVTPY